MKRNLREDGEERDVTGSEANKPSEPRFFCLGYIARAHGISGEMWVNIQRRMVLPPLNDVTHVFLGEVKSRRELQSFRFHRGGLLLKLESCADRNAAEALRGQEVCIPDDKWHELSVDEYYVKDLIGLRVLSVQGEYLGELVEVILTGANDVYRIINDDDELLLPAISTVIRAVQIDNREMLVNLLPGLRSLTA